MQGLRMLFAAALVVSLSSVPALAGPANPVLGTVITADKAHVGEGTATVGTSEGGEVDEGNLLPAHPQWLAWLCILAGPALFVVFGSIGGMAPATFACVFVAALGDRDATWKSAFILAALVTVFGVALFHYLLQIPMQVLEWHSPLQLLWGR